VWLDNFRQLLGDAIFGKAVRNTLVWALLAVATEIPLGFLLALVLASKLPGAGFFRVAWFLPVMLSEVIVAITWSLIYEPRVGLLNRSLEAVGLSGWIRVWLGDPKLALYALIVVSTWMWTGFNMVLYLAGITSIPKDLLDAALVDGASGWQQVRYVIWPLLRNLTVTLVVLSFTGKLKVFGLPWVATPRGGPLGATETVSTYLVRRAFFYPTFDLGYPAAIAVVWFLVIMVFAILLMRSLRRRERLEL
jgi:multiple sugar transport system permease protein/raffinose/stachyose/melibiose transport system permease protein